MDGTSPDPDGPTLHLNSPKSSLIDLAGDHRRGSSATASTSTSSSFGGNTTTPTAQSLPSTSHAASRSGSTSTLAAAMRHSASSSASAGASAGGSRRGTMNSNSGSMTHTFPLASDRMSASTAAGPSGTSDSVASGSRRSSQATAEARHHRARPSRPGTSESQRSLPGSVSAHVVAGGSGGRSRLRSHKDRDKDTMEMSSLSGLRSSGQSAHTLEEIEKRERAEKAKQDEALNKWRKWIVEQPSQSSPDTSPLSKQQQRKATPTHIPLISLGPISINAPSAASTLRRRPTNTSRTQSSTNSASPGTESGPSSLTQPITPTLTDPNSGQASPPFFRGHQEKQQQLGHERQGSNDRHDDLYGLEVYTTESVRALRDVELAVDHSILSKLGQGHPRQATLSTRPRVSNQDNPFVDIANRLGSRRIRPLVLELVQALGHFIDAVWCTSYPDRPCPWIAVSDEDGGPEHRDVKWTSRVVTAVQEGKRLGHVANPPTHSDVTFWENEVKHSLRDVDEVVGIYKGVGWAFERALTTGGYGEVSPEGVTGPDGSGGDLVRLTNDLEEALWGDASPRPTDLSYEIPYDFDPYAQQSEETTNLQATESLPLVRRSSQLPYEWTLKDGRSRRQSSNDDMDGGNPRRSNDTDRTEKQLGGDTIMNTDTTMTTGGTTTDSGSGGETLSLAEIGKRRHAAWLASKRLESGAG